MEMGG